ncbi:MAG TPA: hypothetical protein VJ803_12965 [Gemmatimonadaceae bacterium]|nr:hypothetical protein [Gemmatimonadaceae bacterium]
MSTRRSIVARGCLIVLPLVTGPADAQQPAAQPEPCSSAEHRQFDFWIGEWDVQGQNGQQLGQNTITSILKGCVVQESWKGQRGMTGTSFNKYDPRDRKWHQVWVDDTGGFLHLSGEYKDGKMMMTGETPTMGGGKTLHRLSFERVKGDADRLRQFWQISNDGGQTWQVSFDGIYVRRQ